MNEQQILEVAGPIVQGLVTRQGLSRAEAVRMVSGAIRRRLQSMRGGLGDTASEPASPALLDQIAKAGNDPTVAAVRNAVTPWLWVTSLVGFGMGLMNSRRIAIMYRNWRAKQRR